MFAGIGLLDYALDKNGWGLDLAVDYDTKKKKMYSANFPDLAKSYALKDVFSLSASEIPSSFLGHASFPCTDVSSAGRRQGVGNGLQSSAIDSVLGLRYGKEYHERPAVLLTENVKGLLTSNGGKDIHYLLTHYSQLGYHNDILFVDAKYFVPQSRQRIFIISMKKEVVPPTLVGNSISVDWLRPEIVIKTIRRNPKVNWLHLKSSEEPSIKNNLEEIVDHQDQDYWSDERKDYLINQMSARHLRLLDEHINDPHYSYFTVFRRMRVREGKKQSTAEIRSDGLAGCLRTAKGGSAKQILLRVGKGSVDVRLLNARECARLMGAPRFTIDESISTNDYLFGFGDGVCSSVIEFIDQQYLTSIFEAQLDANLTTEPDTTYTMNLPTKVRQNIRADYKSWREDNMDKTVNLPIKGRLYGAMIVVNNLRDKSDPDWSYTNPLKIKNTDNSTPFNHRSIQGPTIHRLKLGL